MVLPVSSVFDCFAFIRVCCQEKFVHDYILLLIYLNSYDYRLISRVAGSTLTTSFAHSSTQIKHSYLLLNYTSCLCLLVCPPNHHPIIVFFLAMSAKRW